jgi:hypothetical protein
VLANCAHRRGNEAIKVNNTADAKRMYERGLKVSHVSRALASQSVCTDASLPTAVKLILMLLFANARADVLCATQIVSNLHGDEQAEGKLTFTCTLVTATAIIK